jgi:ubiquinone/menaquinone biosynthesis C-methylase UbiE
MTDATSGQVSAEAARLYERFFVPALFDQWPPKLLRTAAVGPGQSVLDVGCGTGVLARAVAGCVGPAGRVQGVDLNEGMLAVARALAPELVWTRGAAEELPIATASQDRVLSQFALMFFADQQVAVQEMARVLRPEGRVCVATWAEVDTSPGYAAMVTLLRRLFGDGPADALLAPFSIGTCEQLRQIMVTTFPDLTVRRIEGIARFPSLDDWVHTDIRAWTLRDMIDDAQFQELRQEARRALAGFCGEDGQVTFAAPALVAHAHR